MRTLSQGAIDALFFIQKYRFLTIAQFAKLANYSAYHSAEVLRRLEGRGYVGYFGFAAIPPHGRTPKVFFLTRRGYEFLQTLTEEPLGPFIDVEKQATWTPQMPHRLRLLDLFIALE